MNEVTPSIYKETGSFRHWCYKVLPLVYDDSLSYYELLCKVVKAIGDVISNVDGVREDMIKLVEAYNELKKYVDTYFDNLDVSAEVDKKLDEMAADGTLADIINDQIFQDLVKKLETEISRVPFELDDANKKKYLDESTKAIASYFASGVSLDSVIGQSNVTPKTAYVYTDGDKGYMGVLGQGETGFVYTDTKVIDGLTYPVAYIDCSQFVSLITKCRDFANSPYEYAFKNKDNINNTTLRNRCMEMGYLDEDEYYTFDFFNYIYSARMAFVMNNSGNQVRLVSSKLTSAEVEFSEYAKTLEDGDLLFIGNPTKYSGKEKRYLGLHHVGVFYKTLDKLNAAAAQYNISLRDIDNGLKNEYGYIVHSTGTTGEATNTLRINTLYAYANTLPTEGVRLIYSCKPYANSLNSNKARRAISYMFSEYDKFGFGDRNGNYNYIRYNEDDKGRMLFQQISYNGAQIPAGSDLNTIGDGYYRCSDKKNILNMPDVNSSVFDLITVGTEAGVQTGMQILVTGNQGIAFRKAGVKGSGRKWGDWGIYEVGGVTPTPTQRKFACGFIEFSGGLPAQTKTIQNIDYSSSGFTNPRVFLTFQCGNDFSYGRYPNISVSIGTKTATGAEIVAVNANEVNLGSFGVFWFAIDKD